MCCFPLKCWRKSIASSESRASWAKTRVRFPACWTVSAATAIAKVELHRHLEASFPRVHRTLTREVIGGASLLYRWKGRVRRDAESLLVIKTTVSKLKALERWVKARHPYEVPEFVALPVSSGSKEYLSWLHEQVR